MADARRIQGFLTGYVNSLPAAEQIIAAIVAPAPAQIRTVFCEADVVGTGTAIIDVRVNGTSVWTNPGHRPSIPAGQSGTFLAHAPDRSAIRRGDRIILAVVDGGNRSQFIATAALEEP